MDFDEADVDSSPEVPKSVSSIIQKFKRISSLDTDTSESKDKASSFDTKEIKILSITKLDEYATEDEIEKSYEMVKEDSICADIQEDVEPTDVSPATQLRNIVEDIETKVDNISKAIHTESSPVTEVNKVESDIDNQIENLQSASMPDMQQEHDDDKRKSVRELVKRHELIVRQNSQDVIEKEKICKMVDREVAEEELDKVRSADGLPLEDRLDDGDESDWEMVERDDFEELEPFHLPSPINQQYRDFTSTSDFKEQEKSDAPIVEKVLDKRRETEIKSEIKSVQEKVIETHFETATETGEINSMSMADVISIGEKEQIATDDLESFATFREKETAPAISEEIQVQEIKLLKDRNFKESYICITAIDIPEDRKVTFDELDNVKEFQKSPESPISDEDLVERPTHISRESSISLPDDDDIHLDQVQKDLLERKAKDEVLFVEPGTILVRDEAVEIKPVQIEHVMEVLECCTETPQPEPYEQEKKVDDKLTFVSDKKESEASVEEKKNQMVKSEQEEEHDSYFIEEAKQINVSKQKVLLSRQESNIEITIAEYGEPVYDYEYSTHDRTEAKETENEYDEKEAEIEDSQSAYISSEKQGKQLTSANDDIIAFEITDQEPTMEDTKLHGRVFSDILEAATDEMEGEPLGFSVEPTADEENEYLESSREHEEFYIQSEEIVMEVNDEIYSEKVCSIHDTKEDIQNIKLEQEVDYFDKGDGETAQVIEIIEGYDDEDEYNRAADVPPSPQTLSETVEYDELANRRTSDYDMALNYTDRVEHKVDNETKQSVLNINSSEIEHVERQNFRNQVKKETTQLQEETGLKEKEFLLYEMDEDKNVELEYRYDVDGFDETFIDRTESFLEHLEDDKETYTKSNGLRMVGIDDIPQNISAQTYQISKGDATSDALHGSGEAGLQDGVSDHADDEYEDVESDSLEDDTSECDHKVEIPADPEQISLKSSERPLSPTDYTLDPYLDESFIGEDKSKEDTDGILTADTSKQIFIEQSIQKKKESPVEKIRTAADGIDKFEDLPPSPSEYTLVSSYEQEKLKKVLSTPEKKSPQFSRLVLEDSMSVSMDETVLQRNFEIEGERNIMSASYDEEALKRVYDEEDIMASSTEHVMQDSLIASSLEPDEFRVTGSICSGKDEDYSVSSSDQGVMEKSYEGDIMTDSYDDSLRRSGGSAKESGLSDSMDLEVLKNTLEFGQTIDPMASSMSQDALNKSLEKENVFDEKSLLHGKEERGMIDSLEQEQLTKSLDIVREETALTSSMDDELIARTLGFGKETGMEASMDQEGLKVSLGIGKTADLMTTSMEFDDLDALHRSLGLAGSESHQETSKSSKEQDESPTLDQAESISSSMDQDALRKSFGFGEDIMSSSMDPEALQRSLGISRTDDVALDSVEHDASADLLDKSPDSDYNYETLRQGDADPMMVSMDQDALTASLGLDRREDTDDMEQQEISRERISSGPIDIMTMSMDQNALYSSLGLGTIEEENGEKDLLVTKPDKLTTDQEHLTITGKSTL